MTAVAAQQDNITSSFASRLAYPTAGWGAQAHHVGAHVAAQCKPNLLGKLAADKRLADDMRLAHAGEYGAISKSGHKQNRNGRPLGLDAPRHFDFRRVLEHVECRAAAAGLKHRVAALAQHGSSDIAHRIVVINNKYVRGRQFGGLVWLRACAVRDSLHEGAVRPGWRRCRPRRSQLPPSEIAARSLFFPCRGCPRAGEADCGPARLRALGRGRRRRCWHAAKARASYPSRPSRTLSSQLEKSESRMAPDAADAEACSTT